MGLAESFGVKTIRLHLQGKYADTRQLFSVIQNLDFRDAGSPLLVPCSGKMLIVWPEIDRQNQVQIFGKSNRFILKRSSQPACGNAIAKNLALSASANVVSPLEKGMNICMGYVDLVERVLLEAGI